MTSSGSPVPATLVDPQTMIQAIQQQYGRDIFYMASVGDLNGVKEMLDGRPQHRRMDINAADANGNTALHWAAYRNQPKLVEYLLRAGANPEMANSPDGQTPLHWACVSGNIICASLIITVGNVTPMAADRRGYNAFHTAAMNGHLNLVHYLILLHAKQSKQNSSSATWLKTIIDTTDSKGHTALAWAAFKGHDQIILYLIRRGADATIADVTGMTPLHWAAQKGHKDCVKIICERSNADLTAKDKQGSTSVQHAESKGHNSIVSYLKHALSVPIKRSQMNSASNKSMWFAIPLFFFYIITAMAQNLPFLVTVVCSGVMALITKLAVGKWWPGQSIRNPFWFGSFVAAYSLSAIYYFTTILPNSLNQLALHIVFLTSNFGLLGLYTYLFKSDPGWLVDKKNPVDDETFLTEAVSGRQVTLCPSCMTQKCLRSKHCRSCDKCVAKMDHHCYWINNCVGSNNHREFMGLLMLMCIMHLLFLVMCCRHLLTLPDGPATLIFGLPYFWRNDPFGVLCIIWHVVSASWQAQMVYQQFKNISENLTYNETVNLKNYKIFWTNERFWNPFDKGSKLSNVKEFFNPSVDWKKMYRLNAGNV